MATEFEVFRRKLADAVTIAINSGVKVSASDPFSYCPIGCLTGARRPSSIRRTQSAFIVAFDHGEDSGDYPEYSELGLAYRKRFP